MNSGARLARLVALAITVAGVSVVAVARASPRRLAAGQNAQRYVESALDAGFKRSGCRLVPIPAANPGTPPASLLSTLGVLRSGTEPSASTVQQVAFGTTDLYRHYVRLARPAFGLNWYVLVAGPYLILRPPRHPDACLDVLRSSFRREKPRVPATLRRVAQQQFTRDLLGERRQFAFEKRVYSPPLPVGAELVAEPTFSGFLLSSGALIAHNPPRQVGAGVDAAEIDRGEAFNVYGATTFTKPTREATILSGIVPDGIATVTVYYPALRRDRRTVAARFSIKMHVIGNVVVASLPRMPVGSLIPRMVWRNGEGRVVRVISGGPHRVASPGV